MTNLYAIVSRVTGITAIGLALVAIMVVPRAAQAQSDYGDFLSAYNALLAIHVRPGARGEVEYLGVDYIAWETDQNHAVALRALSEVDPVAFNTLGEKMAFWINTYNFLTIDLIVRERERESIRNLGSLFRSPWKKHRWEISERLYTLDQIEHEILRPMGDARVHFAINCASVSCPDQRLEAYDHRVLDASLDDQVALALANSGKGLHARDGTLYVSKIFDWFEEDFNDGNIETWLAQYVELGDDISLRYLDYDWSLNNVE